MANVSIEAVAKKIIEGRGEKFPEWKKEMIDQKKMEVLSGKDREWEKQVIADACLQVALEKLEKGGV